MTGNKRPGFTLIELLIVSAIFSVTFLIATSVFVSVQKNQRGIAGRQRIVTDGRYILEAMARSIRVGTIDYTYYRDPDANGDPSDNLPLSNFQTVLAVRDQDGVQTCYRINGTSLESTSGGNDCALTTTTWTPITPTDIQVTRFQVTITPSSDPFLGQRLSPTDCGSGAPTAEGTCACIFDTDEYDLVNCLPEQRCVQYDTDSLGNPLAICLNANRQPTVTLVLETKNNTATPGEQSAIALQTTVTSRVIKR